MSDQGLSIFDEPDDAAVVDEEPTQVIEAQGQEAKPAAKPARKAPAKPQPPQRAQAPAAQAPAAQTPAAQAPATKDAPASPAPAPTRDRRRGSCGRPSRRRRGLARSTASCW